MNCGWLLEGGWIAIYDPAAENLTGRAQLREEARELVGAPGYVACPRVLVERHPLVRDEVPRGS